MSKPKRCFCGSRTAGGFFFHSTSNFYNYNISYLQVAVETAGILFFLEGITLYHWNSGFAVELRVLGILKPLEIEIK